jgi:ATP-dependent phosphofructokinase / diphosphate-dependent phosphofructokinase
MIVNIKDLLEVFRKYNIRYFFYNGGNDSMDTCNKISKFFKKAGFDCNVMGVPKTIDNDLNVPIILQDMQCC